MSQITWPSVFLTGIVLTVLSGCGTPTTTHSAQAPAPTVADPLYADGGVSAFYRTTTLPTQPGFMIRTETLAGVPLPDHTAQAVRTLYSATKGTGAPTPVAVSGQILFPQGTMPAGGWPVIAWEHGTTGVADRCAPSWHGYSERDRAYLSRWLQEGFAVVASDYQGLGTEGPHPYLLYKPEGYSVLDGLRAALKQFPEALQNTIILVGQSQGSGAALGTAWLAPRYAPDLHIRGVVATGLVVAFTGAAHPKHPLFPDVYTGPGDMNPAFAMLRVEGTDQSLHPETDARTLMTPTGLAMSHVAHTGCLRDLVSYAHAHNIKGADLFTEQLPAFEQGRTEAFLIPDAHLTMPVFAGTGLADGTAGVKGQYNAVATLCDAGSHVMWYRYPGLTHNGAVNASLKDSLPFVRRLLKGERTPSNCAAITQPGPVEAATPGIPWNQ